MAHRPIRRDWCAFFMGFRIDSDTKLLIEETRVDLEQGIIAPVLREVSWTGLEMSRRDVLIKGQNVYKKAVPRGSVFGKYVPDLYGHGIGEDPLANQPDSPGGYIDHIVNGPTKTAINAVEIQRIRRKNG